MKKAEFLKHLAKMRNDAAEDMMTANKHGWLTAWSEASGRRRAIENIQEMAKYLEEPKNT